MTSRRSSGSSRADSAVEPTRSQNITVSCRRSAVGAQAAGSSGRCPVTAAVGDGGAERGDRVEQLAAMADQGDAEMLQILGRQLRQHFAIDLVVAERRRVLFEPQPPQPRRYVHAVILGSEERQPLMVDDIPLPFELPAAALKYVQSQVSGQRPFWSYQHRNSGGSRRSAHHPRTNPLSREGASEPVHFGCGGAWMSGGA